MPTQPTTQKPRPGDFGVTATTGISGWFIRLVTRSKYNHAFIVIDDTRIIEAKPSGADYNAISAYPHAYYSSQAVPLTEDQRPRIVRWAIERRGTPYSWIDDAEIGFVDLFGWAPKWMRDRLRSLSTLQCAQYVDADYNLSVGIHLFTDDRPAGGVSPADLAQRIGAP